MDVGRSFLVVEQDYSSLTELAALLLHLGYRDVSRAGCDGALRAMEESRIDLVLIETSRSGVHLQTLRQIRWHANAAIRTTPIVAVTCDGREASIRALRDAGVNYIALRPLTRSVMELFISVALKDSRAFIQTESYRGPDRRRTLATLYTGPDRRSSAKDHLYVA